MAAQHHQVTDLNLDHLRKLPPFKKEDFEAQVGSTKRRAVLVAGMELVSRFLGFCALTWATVVLLGGFAPALRLLDFYLIIVLLLLEGARLFIVQMFSKLLSRALFRELSLPRHFRFIDRQPSKALQLDLMGQALSFFLACASCISAIVRLVLSAYGHPLSEQIPPADGHSNLPTSLRIFYILVICNSAFAIAPRLLRPLLRQRCHGNSICLAARSCFSRQGSSHVQKPLKQDSLMCFHDEVYKTAMEAGLPEADQLSILDFAFTKLARDHQRNIWPPLVKELNMDMIRYLYHGQHGIAMACEYLHRGDVWKQIVAANLPGFWVGEERIESQVALFWALRERMCGAGKDAESALNSIECLGQAWARRLMSPTEPHPFLINDHPAAPATNVVDTLVRLLLEPISPTLLFQVRAFEACCRHWQILRHLYKLEEDNTDGGAAADPETACAALQALIVRQQRRLDGQMVVEPEERPSRLRELCRKLHAIVAGTAGGITWTATNIYAGNALLSLLCDGRDELLGQAIRDCFKDPVDKRINPTEATYGNAGRHGRLPYFWVNDLQVVEKLRFRVGLDPYPRWRDVRLIQFDGKVLSDPGANFLNEPAIVQLVAQARQPYSLSAS